MTATDIRIDSGSDVPIRRQLTEQIIFRIATGALTPEHPLPSVRELARRLKIHHNTVSGAYKDLVDQQWIARRRGSRMVVVARETLSLPGGAKCLDDVINLSIHLAQAMGYSLQALRARVRDRLMAVAPDHILVIEPDVGMREILRNEIGSALPYPVETCSQEDLAQNPGLAIGAMAVSSLHSVGKADELFPKDRPVIALAYNKADEHIRRIRELPHPSLIAVVSSSARFLAVARGVLAPAIGKRHQLREVLLREENPSTARAADLVICDSTAKRLLRSPKALHYQMVASRSLEEITSAMKSYQILA